MNFTRWSARLPGTQRRAAARDDRSSVPPARAEYAQPRTGPCLPDGDTRSDTPGGTGVDTPGEPPGDRGPAALEDLSARDILGRLPALVALVYGPDHRIAYVNDAYAAAFGPRPAGATAAEAMPELTELSLLPLMDQVLRSGTPRTVKSRRVRSGNSYTVTCTPVYRDRYTDGEDETNSYNYNSN
ncbi:PAS domain-containing protein, partial [Streptomyces sp. NPDC088178]|uniref:PAS domain-containing protein n=1 Tax=Streptomyces sp. NPDC088178 TaxID=3365836 RepID=UPI00381E077D